MGINSHTGRQCCEKKTHLYCGIVVIALNVILIISIVTLLLTYASFDKGSYISSDDSPIKLILRQLNQQDIEQEVIKVQEDLSTFYGNAVKPAAHLSIATELFTENVVTLSWNQNHSSSLLSQGVKYVDGCLVVPHSGYYFVYSQILYSGEGTRELDHGRIIHNVNMQKVSEEHETPTILMQNLQSTPTIRRGRLAYITSSLGATFFLEKNAKVMVDSSIPKNIDTSPSCSYFGLHLI